MNKRLLIRLIFFFSLACCFKNFGQVDHLFLKHLVEHDLAREHETYLLTVGRSLQGDSIRYFTAKFHLLYFNDTLFLKSYRETKATFDADTNAYNLASIAFLTARHKDAWFSGVPNRSEPLLARQIRFFYRATQNPSEIDPAMLAEDLQQDFISYKKACAKKPIVAAALSVVVPGLGQLYIGKRKSFVNTLIMNLAYAVQAYEACYKLGVKKPYSMFSIGFFGLFYISNIYGSYSDTKVVKKEKKKQLILNGAHYYNINYSGKLYQ